MGGYSRFEIAYFHHPWREFADAETLEAKIESTESTSESFPLFTSGSLHARPHDASGTTRELFHETPKTCSTAARIG
jgi:hypothetical protein